VDVASESSRFGTEIHGRSGIKMKSTDLASVNATVVTPGKGVDGPAPARRAILPALASLSPLELMLVARSKTQRVAEGTDATSFIAFGFL
jgi:hypothetical protein